MGSSRDDVWGHAAVKTAHERALDERPQEQLSPPVPSTSEVPRQPHPQTLRWEAWRGSLSGADVYAWACGERRCLSCRGSVRIAYVCYLVGSRQDGVGTKIATQLRGWQAA